MVSLENPQMLWLLIPTLVAGLYLIRKGSKKKIVTSRMIVAALLIIALASPQTLVSRSIIDDTPDIVVISDETDSMELFKEGTATNIYNSLTAKTPTTIVKLTGDKTNLGDAIVQYSRGDNQIVLITDGNNNHGTTLEDSLKFAKETGTTVYSVEPELEVNDISVEIKGDKTVVIDNDNLFEVIVSQAEEEEISYDLEVYEGDKLIRSGTFSQSTREKTILVSHTFTSLGSHNLRVDLNPRTFDRDPINNQFYKAIYVVPKPKVKLITDDTTSPLATITGNLYDVSTTDTFSDIEDRKAVVLDNQHINTLSSKDVADLKSYVSDGNGLVVVGGDRTYDLGDYLNSSFEELLPVVSRPTEYRGGRNVVLLLDVSQSTAAHGTQADVLGNGINILRNENLRDAHGGVIVFGSEGYDVSNGLVFLGIPSNIERLEEEIKKLTPSATSQTSLDKGLLIAQQWLEGEAGELDVIIISDGGIEQVYEDSLEIAIEIHEEGVNFFYIHIKSSAPSQKDISSGVVYAQQLMEEVDGTYFPIDIGERAKLEFEEIEEPEEEEEITITSFPLIEFNPNHFITRNIEVAGNITGFNDVTPKAGADRIIITATGKPVLTTWRFGLGRVATITTDNGEGAGNRWASALYSGNNSKVLSSTVNWAIGNPREEKGAVLEGMDTWFGTPVILELTMFDEGVPSLSLNGENLELSVTGRNTYETSINPGRIGIHDVSGYPVAVNYALEYRDVGINEDLEKFIKENGGKTYTEKEARALLLQDARLNSQRIVKEPVSYKIYFILAALLVFLGEILVRRVREIQEAKRIQRGEE